MSGRREFLQRAGGLVLGAGLAGLGAPSAASVLPVDPFFGRSFEGLDGQTFELSSLIGRPVLANFWASWCAPCVREMPDLDALHHAHPDVAFLGLAIDTRTNVERFVQKVSVSYPVLLTGTQGIPLMRDLGNKGGGLPFTALFDAQGRSAGVILGEVDPADIRRRLGELLQA
uniref:TlpA family protein disulfide reductase n=1 Tax=Castellaniella defragrans TaxID=75697 RepID=UPI00333FC5C6